MVAANYGLARRNLGAVSVLGPGADGLPGGDHRGPPGGARAVALRRRGLRRVSRATPTRCSGSSAAPTRRQIKKRFRVRRARAAPRRQLRRPTPRSGSRRRPRHTRCSPTPSGARSTTATAGTGSTRAARRPHAHGFGSFADIFDAFFGGDPFGGGRARAGPGPGRRRRRRGRDHARAGGAAARASRSPTTRSRPATAATATAPSPARRSRPATRCGGTAASCARSRGPRSGSWSRTHACDVCGGDGQGGPHAVLGVRRPRDARRSCGRCEVDVPAGIADGQRDPTDRPRPRRASAADRPATSTCSCAWPRTSASCATAATSCSVVDVARPAAALGDDRHRADARRRARRSRSPPGTQPGTIVTLRGHGMPQIGRGRRGDQQVVLNVVIPRNLDERQRELLDELAGERSPRTTSHEPRARVARRQGPPGAALIRLAVRAPAVDGGAGAGRAARDRARRAWSRSTATARSSSPSTARRASCPSSRRARPTSAGCE